MNRALVLGGGGVTGIAWHLGILGGLQRAGVPLGDADTIIGTSAGSVVGTLVAAGGDLESAIAEQLVATPAAQQRTEDSAAQQRSENPAAGRRTEDPAVPRRAGEGGGSGDWMTVMAVLADPSVPAREARARVGVMALDAETVDEETYLYRMRSLVPAAGWPDRDLRITVVDTADGRDLTLGPDSGATLLQAVAASCAVPGLMPPVTIDGRRYMDGGVRVGAAADLAAGADRLVVLAPLAVLGRERIVAEMAASGAAETLLIEPDPAALEAIGPNVMDPARRPAAVRAGLRQAEELAPLVRKTWG